MHSNLSGVWMNIEIYIAHFPFSNEINTTKTDSSVKAAVKNASDYNDVDVCMSSAVKSGHIIFIYIVLYAIVICNSLPAALRY